MNYLIIYVVTVLSSFGINGINELIMYNDASKRGYKLDSKRINSNKFRKENKIPKNMSFLIFLPIINIIKAYVDLLKYEIKHEEIIDRLEKLDATIKMNEKEQEIYKEFPNGITSALLNVRENEQTKSLAEVTIDNSRIYYDLNDEGQIVIEKVTGPLSKKTPQEQIEALKEYREQLLKSNNSNLKNQPKIRIR